MNLEESATREQASIAAASRIVAAVERRLGEQARTRLIVTGGSSPLQCYAYLSQADIDWRSVQLLLSDERWVPAEHVDSNEKMVRACLLTGKAVQATLLPFFAADTTLAARCDEMSQLLAGLDSPAACALLGMGDDGHFASLFPDAANLSVGLQADSATFCIPVDTAASPHQRISLTLSELVKSEEIVLLCFGDAKREVIDQDEHGAGNFPISHLLKQSQVPVTVFWAP